MSLEAAKILGVKPAVHVPVVDVAAVGTRVDGGVGTQDEPVPLCHRPGQSRMGAGRVARCSVARLGGH
jgi:hypothetical protein